MIFLHEGDIIDIDLPLLMSVCSMLDQKTTEVIAQADSMGQLDSLGILDELEHLLGFGIVGVQTYITTIASFAGLKKHETFQYSPMTYSGVSKIKIINAVANFWKHRSEWVLGAAESRKNAIDVLFEEVGYSTDSEYPVSGVIRELVSPKECRLTSLIEILVEWRNSLMKDTVFPNLNAEQDGG